MGGALASWQTAKYIYLIQWELLSTCAHSAEILEVPIIKYLTIGVIQVKVTYDIGPCISFQLYNTFAVIRSSAPRIILIDSRFCCAVYQFHDIKTWCTPSKQIGCIFFSLWLNGPSSFVKHIIQGINSSPPEQRGPHFADDIFRCILLMKGFILKLEFH